MSNKILVTYATRTGSTKDIADYIGNKITATGMLVDVKSVKQVNSIKEYDAIILGSAVRMGKLMPEMTKFVLTYKADLCTKKVAAFAVCMSVKDGLPEKLKEAQTYLAGLRAETDLVSEGFFAGNVDFTKMNFLLRFMLAKMAKIPQGTFIDYKKVEEWTSLTTKLFS